MPKRSKGLTLRPVSVAEVDPAAPAVAPFAGPPLAPELAKSPVPHPD